VCARARVPRKSVDRMKNAPVNACAKHCISTIFSNGLRQSKRRPRSVLITLKYCQAHSLPFYGGNVAFRGPTSTRENAGLRHASS